SEGRLAVSAGGDNTVRVMLTVCGLPMMAMPALFTAASEIVPVYVPAASADDVTVTVKVAVLRLAIIVDGGVTASQPLPFVIVAVGVIVTLPEQPPMMPMVKVCAAGFSPVSLVNAWVLSEGACNPHAGCTISVTVTSC